MNTCIYMAPVKQKSSEALSLWQSYCWVPVLRLTLSEIERVVICTVHGIKSLFIRYSACCGQLLPANRSVDAADLGRVVETARHIRHRFQVASSSSFQVAFRRLSIKHHRPHSGGLWPRVRGRLLVAAGCCHVVQLVVDRSSADRRRTHWQVDVDSAVPAVVVAGPRSGCGLVHGERLRHWERPTADRGRSLRHPRRQHVQSYYQYRPTSTHYHRYRSLHWVSSLPPAKPGWYCFQ